MNQNLPQELERESLSQLSKEELVNMIIEQSKAIRELQQEIERLKVSRDLDSSNSSKPPSGDIHKKSENKKAPPQEESNQPKKKPGGQPGHQGKTRKGFGRVDRYEIISPTDCVYCGQKAFASVAVKVEKQTVAQLVERPIEIVEYQRQTCVCECCGNIQTAHWPQDVIPGQDLGIKLQAFLGWANNYDDYSVYNGYQAVAQQKCLAHLRRHFKKLIQLPGLHNQAIGKAFVDLIDEAFRNYAEWFETLDSGIYNDWVKQFKFKLQQTLDDWVDLAGATAGKLLRSLRDKASGWWYFLDHPEVPPDNNQAERSLRLAVTKRKVSGGSRSMERFQHTANLLTVVQTCRRQGRSVIDFFVQALIADSNNSHSRPSLLPQY
jgi:hypothetical protein